MVKYADLPPIHRYVGRIIHVLRKERGMRQSELAALTGLKQPNLSRIENGLVVPRHTTLEKVATALDVGLKELLSEQKVMEVERKWHAALSPRNAGQLFANQLAAVPLYRVRDGYGVLFAAPGQPRGEEEFHLQLPWFPGHAFATRVADDAMESTAPGAPSFHKGRVLVFAEKPAVKSGDCAYVQAEDEPLFRRVWFEGAGAPLRLEALNRKYPERKVARDAVRGLWRLLRYLEEF